MKQLAIMRSPSYAAATAVSSMPTSALDVKYINLDWNEVEKTKGTNKYRRQVCLYEHVSEGIVRN